jgi:hypothetical protein
MMESWGVSQQLTLYDNTARYLKIGLSYGTIESLSCIIVQMKIGYVGVVVVVITTIILIIIIIIIIVIIMTHLRPIEHPTTNSYRIYYSKMKTTKYIGNREIITDTTMASNRFDIILVNRGTKKCT